MTYYEELGVSTSASMKEIKHAYRRMASALHPDRPEGDTERFKRVQRAYDTLIDPEKRKHYDQFGEQQVKRSPRERALEQVVLMAMNVIDHEDIQKTNLVKLLRRQIMEALPKLEEQTRALRERVRRVHEARSRVTHAKEGVNLLGMMLATQARALELKLQYLEDEPKVAQEMLAILEEHTYRVDIQQMVSYGYGMGPTTSGPGPFGPFG